MGFLSDLLFPPIPSGAREEVERMVKELVEIGPRDDFLSERPGQPFNNQCRHIRGVEIGKRLNDLGGYNLMDYVLRRVRRKLGKELAAHLEYCWMGIGSWLR
ncbi:MAG: hypothetical protein GYA48_07160 [Chloroflexi bacterium]|nr:hypothetical protein [Chloroflexota bacterium]